MVELFIPRHAIPPPPHKGVPASMRGDVSAVCRSMQDCEDIIKWFGSADAKPRLPILLVLPGMVDARGTPRPIIVAGEGFATAAELRDLCVTSWGRAENRLRATRGTFLDFDALREKHGLMRREEVAPGIRDAIRRRIAAHRANPRTDPARQPMRPVPGGIFDPEVISGRA